MDVKTVFQLFLFISYWYLSKGNVDSAQVICHTFDDLPESWGDTI